MVYDQIWDEPAVWSVTASRDLQCALLVEGDPQASGRREQGVSLSPPPPHSGGLPLGPLHFTFSAEEAQAHKALVKVTQPGTDGQGALALPKQTAS